MKKNTHFHISKNKVVGLSIFYFCICVLGSLLSLNVETLPFSRGICAVAFFSPFILFSLLIIDDEDKVKKILTKSSRKDFPQWAKRLSKILEIWLVITFLLCLIDFWKSGFFPIPLSEANSRVLLTGFALFLYGDFDFFCRYYFYK